MHTNHLVKGTSPLTRWPGCMFSWRILTVNCHTLFLYEFFCTNRGSHLTNAILAFTIVLQEPYLCLTDACSLTLDANTAAESLFLHNGGKQVTWVRETQSYSKHPDRFESVSQVLCHQGLQQRHYWEVEWRGRWVDVAVAAKGIRRRASSHLCGFGCTNQSWTLSCFEDHCTAQHNNKPVCIPTPPSGSHRVGVYLNCPGGTLSFYCISSSGSIRHIYTFHSAFTEPLYPGFAMEEDDCSVTICTIGENGTSLMEQVDATM